jgi:hypothetical protein
MGFYSQFSTNALQRLERLTASLTAGRPNRAAIAHAISAMDSVLADLRTEIANDGLGIRVISDEELVFRTARMIINIELDDLDRAIRSILDVDLPRSAKPEMWRGFLRVLPLAKAELWRVTRIWLQYRGDESTTSEPSHDATYRLALKTAFEELDKMDDIPEVERVLYRGIAARWPEIVRPCEQILVAIHAQVDIGAARRTWSALNKWTQLAAAR